MTQSSLKSEILCLRLLWEDTNRPLIELLRPWMLITGLRFEDVLHLTHDRILRDLQNIWSRLKESLDLFQEDQLKEAACRVIRSVTVHGAPSHSPDGAEMPPKMTLEWDGAHWVYISDPKMRIRASSTSYTEALAAVQELLGVEP